MTTVGGYHSQLVALSLTALEVREEKRRKVVLEPSDDHAQRHHDRQELSYARGKESFHRTLVDHLALTGSTDGLQVWLIERLATTVTRELLKIQTVEAEDVAYVHGICDAACEVTAVLTGTVPTDEKDQGSHEPD